MLSLRHMLNLDLGNESRRARFEAVRRRVFSEMRGMASRWRFAMIVPFHLLVIGILATREFPRERLAVQIAASVTAITCLVCFERSTDHRSRGYLFISGLAMLASIANTGGLASPLVLSLVPFFMGVALNPQLENRRRTIAVKFVLVFGLMAWFSRSWSLPAPLVTNVPFATREYVAIAFASASSGIGDR